MAQRALVVGAGMAGLRTAEALRAQGYAGEVLVVGDEPWAPYNRPPLSKEALAGELAHEKVAFRVRKAAADVDWRLGARVGKADLPKRCVELTDGSVLEYDVLVAATGVTARRLEVPGPSPTAAAGRHVVRTLDDAVALRADLAPGRRLVVVGAGFIGCEVAATARGLGCDVTCVAIDPEPMIRPLGAELAAALRRRHEAHGVRFRLGTGVAAFTGDARVTGVVTSDGDELPADVVVEALGSRCATEWLDGHGFDLTDGVLTDAALRPVTGEPTELPGTDGVAVVGDLARFPNPRFGPGAWRVEHWSVPTDTGRRAGAVLAAFLSGDAARYGATVATPWQVLPSFWSDQYELRLQSYGMPGLAEQGGVRVLEGDLEGECVVGYERDGQLVGVVGLGMLPRVNAYRDQVGYRP
ncbi:MAG TPA: FAD-dependent oxidoreductase [Kineosporiaceae bacterium]|nr:FAD-dependent oxidoreductase [Kineosporiaceae bacterium]